MNSAVRPKLSDLLAGLGVRLPPQDPPIQGLTFDSRRAHPGDLYVGLPGTQSHGAVFASAAQAAGAVALLTDAEGSRLIGEATLPVAVADDPRTAMAFASCRFYDYPTRALISFGVTGTNGKSTTVLMLASALDGAGRCVGSIGTLGFRLGGQPLRLDRTTITTPESPDLQSMLAVMRDGGADTMAMEVSSHALALRRVAGIKFDVVGFTNLGRDHLEFHHTMAEYFAAKAQLFTPEYASRAVINGDDEAGLRLLDQTRQLGLAAVSVGFGPDCVYRVVEWHPEGTGSSFTLVHPAGTLTATICLPGDYNVRNAATALAMIDQAGLDMSAALPGLARAVIPGRMQPVELTAPDGRGAPRVYVDFAHTPQAVASALGALNHLAQTSARVIAVLGAGGDRDPDKREPMGRAAVEGADVVVVTDDNPRSEDPAAIRSRVLSGARATVEQAPQGSRTARVECLDGGERSSAIGLALRLARPGDAVAILGKGHERTQQLADRTIDFDDVAVVREQWAEIIAGGAR
ncbi:MAG: UDP-N-acetylmuramoyl-L-alanyl-D-glutamate--2,6-diaminopimelate ligase [Acidobacteriota bacterium]|nr:UDP-N-acetylmuramoyl-L-alanyl-D-glutamate--2,6-diaminopimelate ligase [Acidobacteriota bacterium]